MAPISQAHKAQATHLMAHLPASMRDNKQVSGDILDTIDGALNDYFVSKDAMRWNPEAGETEARCSNSADFSLAMLPPWPAYGELSIYGAAMNPAITSIRRGDIVSIGGEVWRVAGVRETELGHFTYSLEAVDVETLTRP